jgi:hypothetical protein
MNQGAHVPVVLRFRDGRTVRKSIVPQFDLEHETVRVVNEDQSVDQIRFDDLKAVFFPRNTWPVDPGEPELKGSVLAVEFLDGEIIRGCAPEYSPQRNGFFLFPLDRSKNEKVFVVNSAIVSIDVERL